MTVEEFHGDLEEFVDLFHESMGLSDRTSVQKLISVEAVRGTRYGVVRNPNGRVIGMVGLYLDSVAGVRELEPPQIIDYAVDEEHRGLGLGRMLMEWAAENVRHAGESSLWLYTGGGAEIKAIYEKLGFREAGRNPGFWQGKWDRVWYVRDM